MGDRSKNKFTLKIVFSYVILGVLIVVSGMYIRSEIKTYITTGTTDENDVKFIKAGSLFTKLYEAESLSKLALQTKLKKNFEAYTRKIDSILMDIDTLKQFTSNDYQRSLMDSVQSLLKKKVANGHKFLNLKGRTKTNIALDQVLDGFRKMEASLGKITAEGLAPNIATLSPKAQSVIREVADYLNENIPENRKEPIPQEKIDSILNASKALLTRAKIANYRNERSLAQKEIELNRYDMELSHQLHYIITAFEQEIITKTYNDTLKKRTALQRGRRFAGFTAILGLLIVVLFTFLIARDFWKVQEYRKKLEREKQFSESLLKSREQLISTVSHDLRTPLNTITGYSELMQDTPLSEKQVHYLKHMVSASSYVGSLVSDLLDYSKLEANQLHIEKVPFVVYDVIKETSENIKEIHKKKPIALILDIDARLSGRVLGDPFRIRQILENLLGNAYKFTEEGVIKIEAIVTSEQDAKYYTVIKISDSGIGIKKEKQQLIFKEFTQASPLTEKKYGGYGLGLTISKKLAALLGGTLKLESEEGKGSTFTLEFPLEISKIMEMQETPPINTCSIVESTILILDDDPSLLDMLKNLCGHMGMQVHAYGNFKDVPPKAPLEYDLILTDIQMPNFSGFDVLERLKSSDYPHYKKQPIIAMTGRKDLERNAYLRAGFIGVLQKPFTKTALFSLIQKIVLQKTQLHGADNLNAKATSPLFDLSLISTFLDHSDMAIHEILKTFCADLEKNMQALHLAMDRSDIKEIKAIAHKMLPMFRQIKAHHAIPLLETLEQLSPNDLSLAELHMIFMDLEEKVGELQKALSDTFSYASKL